MKLYRVVSGAEATQAKTRGLPATTGGSASGWIGKRLYFWGSKDSARAWRSYFIRLADLQGKKKPDLVVLTAYVPGSDVISEDNPTPVARDFGEVFYITRDLKPSEAR